MQPGARRSEPGPLQGAARPSPRRLNPPHVSAKILSRGPARRSKSGTSTPSRTISPAILNSKSRNPSIKLHAKPPRLVYLFIFLQGIVSRRGTKVSNRAALTCPPLPFTYVPKKASSPPVPPGRLTSNLTAPQNIWEQTPPRWTGRGCGTGRGAAWRGGCSEHRWEGQRRDLEPICSGAITQT